MNHIISNYVFEFLDQNYIIILMKIIQLIINFVGFNVRSRAPWLI